MIMRKFYVAVILLIAVLQVNIAFAQPTVLGTALGDRNTYSTYNLNSVGGFKQYRLQAAAAAGSNESWEFATGTAASPNYTPNWRPYTGGNRLSSNIFIPTSFANGAKYNSTGGGASGLIPSSITTGNYYTFNVSANAAADNVMQLLETNFNPTAISTVTQIPAVPTPTGSVTVTVTLAATPASGENVYVRYSTNSFTSSNIVQCSFAGAVGTAVIPAQAAGTAVRYYAYSSNKSLAAINSDVASYGESVHDMSTLSLNNNSNSNYTYTVSANPVLVTSTGGSSLSATYASVAAAITAINGGTIHTGTINCYVDAGWTETAPPDGYGITATGTAANPIIFQKSGAGANPVFTAGLQITGTTANTNAIFKIVGGDYITIQNFTMQENAGNTVTTTGTANTMTEFGVALFLSAAGNGAQNNTIQNCTISLSGAYGNSAGIFSTSSNSSVNGALEATSTAGTNSNNKIYGNTISNVQYGIYFICPPVTSSINESGNDIGGSSSATGNTITFGSSASTSNPWNRSVAGRSGIIYRNGGNVSIRYNTVNSISTLNESITSNGIAAINISPGTAPTPSYTNTISNNSITVYQLGSQPLSGIEFGYGTTIGIIAASNNTITVNQASASSSSTAINGINASYPSNTATFNGNNISVNESGAGSRSGTVFFINAGSGLGYTTNALTIQGNALQSTGSHIKTTGAVCGIYHSVTITSSGSLNVGGSTPTANTINIARTAAGATYGIQTGAGSSSSVSAYNESYNSITLSGLTGTGTAIGISNTDGGNSIAKAINNNTINISGTNTGSSQGFVLDYGAITLNSNAVTISNAATFIEGVTTTGTHLATLSATGNTINLTSTSAASVSLTGYDFASGTITTSSTIDGGSVAITANSSISPFIGGVYNAASKPCAVKNGTYGPFSAAAAGTSAPAVIGIYLTTGAGNEVSNNIITDFTAGAGSGTMTLTGIIISGGATPTIKGNTVKNISTGAGTGIANIGGIELNGGSGHSVFNNNIYNLSANATGSSLISGITFQSSPTGPFIVYNNFISDLRLPNSVNPNGIFAFNGAATGYTYQVYNNTIKLGSAATPVTGLSGLRVAGVGFLGSSASTQMDMRNNIININANVTGTGFVACVVPTGVTSVANTPGVTFSALSNNNIYYANAGANNYLYVEGSSASALKNGYALSGLTANTTNNIVNDAGFNTTCSLYKLFMGGTTENSSFTEDNLVAGGTTGTFAPTGTSYAENNAQAISSPAITTDFAGVSRTPTNDVGALQFAGVGSADIVAPSIALTPALSGTFICVPVVTATITDAGSGIDNSSGKRPRLYYRKSTEATAFGSYPTDNTSAFNGWKYVETSSSSSPYSFTFDFSLLNTTLASGDVINYFIAAQDLATSPNVGTKSATITGGCPTSVNMSAALSATASNSFTYNQPSVVTASASPAVLCGSGTSVLSLSSTPTLSGVTYQWEQSPTGAAGTYVSVTGGTGATTNSYTTPTITTTTYYRARIYCNGTDISASPTAGVSVTVNTTPSVATTTPGSRCGTGTVTLGATITGTGTLTWYAALTGGSSLGTGTSFVTGSISLTTTYYVAAENGICVSTPRTAVVATVNSQPTALAISPAAPGTLTCGSTQSLAASGGVTPYIYNFGTQASQNTASTTSAGYPAPYTAYYGGQRMQMLIKASELTAAGFVSGSKLTNIQFPVVSLGSGWGSTITSLQSFQMSIGTTSLTTLSSFQTGLTQVISPANFTPVAGYTNTHTFSTPFTWDGTSNIIIETTFSNNISGDATTLVTQYYSPTSYQSTIVYRADSKTAATVAGTTTVSFSYSARPDFKLNGTSQSPITWTPTTGLYTNAAGTTAYTGTNLATVYAAPTATSTVYTATATAAGGCTSTATVTVNVNPSGNWVGGAPGNLNNWFTGANWCGGVVPTSSTNVVIPAGVSNYPIVTTGSALANNINIASGASVTVNGGTFSLNGAVTNGGTFDLTNGTLELAGAGVSVAGSSFTSATVKNLLISNTSSLNGSNLNVTGTVSFGAATGAAFNTGGFLTLVSNAAGTAALGQVVSGNSITGNVSIERYLFAQRSWRFLAAPVTSGSSPTVFNSWQEAGATASTGYGTQITGPSGTGLDGAATPGYSMKSYDMATDAFIPITNTAANIANPQGYMVFVRGDRSVGTAGATTATTLRIKGQVLTGDQTISVIANKSQSFGNPYPSRIDFRNVTKNTVVDAFTIWNPAAAGWYGVGAYDTYTWNGADYANTGGTVRNYIESGEAVLIQSATGGSVVVKETSKAAGSLNVSRQALITDPAFNLNMYTRNAAGDEYVADGVQLNFDAGYSNAVDNDDVQKRMNIADNLFIRKDAKSLIVERHAELTPIDTIFLNLTGTRAANYKFVMTATNMPATGLNAYLKDAYLHSEIPVSLTGQTTTSFDITSDPASKAANRFMIVFKPAAVVPVSMHIISAARQADKAVQVKWKAESEVNIAHYETERSSNARDFATVSTTSALNNGGAAVNYASNDAQPLDGVSYYRIKATGLDGSISYTDVVKVAALHADAFISVAPNPVKNKAVHLQAENLPFGKYSVQVADNAGRIVYRGTLAVSGSISIKDIQLAAATAAGSYTLSVTDEGGKATSRIIFIE